MCLEVIKFSNFRLLTIEQFDNDATVKCYDDKRYIEHLPKNGGVNMFVLHCIIDCIYIFMIN